MTDPQPNAVTMPEHNAETTLTETPTILICLGDGGIEKGKAVHALAEQEGIADRLQLIAINSGSGKFDGLDDTVETVNLRTPDQRFHDHDKAQRHYLKPAHTIAGAPGTQRSRPVGRYYFDNPERIGSHHDQIKRTIAEFVEHFDNDPTVDGPQAVNVFQLVGAGGGTGSGIMPLVTGLLDNILAELEEAHHPGFEQWAVCSLATTDDFDGGGDTPDVDWQYPANSLALLDELRAITGYDDIDYPLRIPLLASKDRANNRRSAYTIDDNPFSGVFLLRFNQDEKSERLYREGVSRTTARLVIEWMRKDQSRDDFEGLENEVNHLNNTFYEVRGTTFEVPTDRIERLLDAKQQYQSATASANTLEAELDDLTAALDQLEIALDATTLVRANALTEGTQDAENDDERPVPEVMETAFKRATQVAGNITPTSTRVDDIKAELSEFQDRRTHTFHDDTPGDVIQRAIFMAAVLEEISSALRDHSFDSLVHDYVDRHEEKLRDYDATFDPTADPKDQFLQTIKPMLSERTQTLAHDLDDLGLTGRLTDREVYTSKKQRLNQLRTTLNELARALEERDALAKLSDAIEDEYDAAHAALETHRDRLAVEKLDVESELETAKQQAAAARRSVDRHKDAVQNAPLGRFVTLPVASGAELQADQFAGDPGIASLIRDGILDRGDISNRIQETLYDHEDGVLGASLETRGKDRSPSQGRPVVFCTEATRDLVWTDAPVGNAPDTIARDEFATQPETVLCNDDHTIGVLAVYGGLSLDNFDHGQLRDSLFEGRATLWGTRIDVEECYAYPEILPSDHPVSLRSQVDALSLPSRGEDDD